MGDAVGGLGERVGILKGITSNDSRRDLVDEALKRAQGARRMGWVWGREEYNGVLDTLPPLQVHGDIQQYHRFTFHDAFAGIDRDAFEQSKRLSSASERASVWERLSSASERARCTLGIRQCTFKGRCRT